MIIDPPNGKVPERTAAGRHRLATVGMADGRRPATGPEDRAPVARCIIRQSVPIRPDGYNSQVRILQTPDHVVVLHEMIHEALVIPLDGRPHLPGSIPQWHRGRSWLLGRRHARGRDHELPSWLDVSGHGARRPHHRTIHSTRRADVAIRVHRRRPGVLRASRGPDATTSWRATDRCNGYACHEGNRSMTLLLEAARAQERAEAEPAGVER